MKYFILFTLLLYAVSGSLNAQNQGNIWYFGSNARLDFSLGKPIELTDGGIFTQEGCATVSDVFGNLLFYTDGRTLYSAKLGQNHNIVIMENGEGLLGDFSSTMSAIVVPHPANQNIYYVFTVDNEGGPNGLCYSKVDMTYYAYGGIDLIKNKQLIKSVTEKITAIQGDDGESYWVIAHEFGNNSFRVYPVTVSGFNESYKKYDVGIPHLRGNKHLQPNSRGYMAPSPDGSKLALANYGQQFIEIFNFNRSDGSITSYDAITKADLNKISDFREDSLYGVEFSPDGTKLYFTGQHHNLLYQYDFNDTSICLIAELPGAMLKFNALKLAPDKKIYIADETDGTLHIINDPDKKGIACNLKINGFKLKYGASMQGLPYTILSPIGVISANNSLCEGSDLVLEARDFPDAVYEWKGPGGWTSDEKKAVRKNVTTDISGTYSVKITSEGKSLNSTVEVVVNPKPYIRIEHARDTISLCRGERFTVTADNNDVPYDKISWSNGDYASLSTEVQALRSEFLVVTVENEFGCEYKDSLYIKVNEGPSVNIAGNNEGCQGDTIELTFTTSAKDYTFKWEKDGTEYPDDSKMINVTEAGLYTVTVTDSNGCSASSDMDVSFISVEPRIIGDSILCEGSGSVLASDKDYPGYQWYLDGTLIPDAGGKQITIDRQGVYKLAATDENGCTGTTEYKVTLVSPGLKIKGGPILCSGGNITLSADKDYESYKWFRDGIEIPGGNSKEITADTPGKYSLEISDINGCIDVDTVDVIFPDACSIFPGEINLGKIYYARTVQTFVQIKNNKDYSIKIADAFIKEGNDKAVTFLGNMPGYLDPGDSLELFFAFRPDRIGVFKRTFVVEIDTPCTETCEIPVRGFGTADLLLNLPKEDNCLYNTDYCIELKGYLQVDDNYTYEAELDSVEFRYDLSVLLPQDSLGMDLNIQSSDELENGERVIKAVIPGKVAVGKNGTVLARICGQLLYGNDSGPIFITDAYCKDSLLNIKYEDGYIDCHGFCRENLSKVRLFQPLSVEINPNPSAGDTKLLLRSSSKGNYRIEIFSLQGKSESVMDIYKTSDNFEEKIPLEISSLRNGMYMVVIRNGSNVASVQLYIIR